MTAFVAHASVFAQDDDTTFDSDFSDVLHDNYALLMGMDVGALPSDEECEGGRECRLKRIFGVDEWRMQLEARRLDILVEDARGSCLSSRLARVQAVLSSSDEAVGRELDEIIREYDSDTWDPGSGTSSVLDFWETTAFLAPTVNLWPDLEGRVREVTVRVFEEELADSAFVRRSILIENLNHTDRALLDVREEIREFFSDLSFDLLDQRISQLDERFIDEISRLDGKIDLLRNDVRDEFNDVRRSIAKLSNEVNFLIKERNEENFSFDSPEDVFAITGTIIGVIPVVGGVASAAIDVGLTAYGAATFEDRSRVRVSSGLFPGAGGDRAPPALDPAESNVRDLRDELVLQVEMSRAYYREIRIFVLGHPTLLRRSKAQLLDEDFVRRIVRRGYWSFLAGLLMKIETGSEAETLSFGQVKVDSLFAKYSAGNRGFDWGELWDGRFAMWDNDKSSFRVLAVPAGFVNNAVAHELPGGKVLLYGVESLGGGPRELLRYEDGVLQSIGAAGTPQGPIALSSGNGEDHYVFTLMPGGDLQQTSIVNGEITHEIILEDSSNSFAGDIAATSSGPDDRRVFGIIGNGHFAQYKWENSQWDWSRVTQNRDVGRGPYGGFEGHIAVFQTASNNIHIFGNARDDPRRLLYLSGDGRSNWTWSDLGVHDFVGKLTLQYRPGVCPLGICLNREFFVRGLTSTGQEKTLVYKPLDGTQTETMMPPREVYFGVRFWNGDWVSDSVLNKLLGAVGWEGIYRLLSDYGAVLGPIEGLTSLQDGSSGEWAPVDVPSPPSTPRPKASHFYRDDSFGVPLVGYSDGGWRIGAENFTLHQVPKSDFIHLIGDERYIRVPVRGGQLEERVSIGEDASGDPIWASDWVPFGLPVWPCCEVAARFEHSEYPEISFEMVRVGERDWRQVIGSGMYEIEAFPSSTDPDRTELWNSALSETFRVERVFTSDELEQGGVEVVDDRGAWVPWDSGDECVLVVSTAFRRGDDNGDGRVDISDAAFTLNWLFLGGDEPSCLAGANTNGDASINIADPTYLLNHLFLGGPEPAAPYSGCGTSDLPIDATLGCLESSCQ